MTNLVQLRTLKAIQEVLESQLAKKQFDVSYIRMSLIQKDQRHSSKLVRLIGWFDFLYNTIVSLI